MTTLHAISRKTLVMAWIALAVLSVITVVAGNFDHRLLPGVIVLLAGLGKAWIIIDHFMELRHSHQGWRLAMLGWPVVMAITIGVMYMGRLSAP